jgi:hypothetical protein
METFALSELSHAIEDALRLGAISYDAVRHLLLCRIERRPLRLDMQNYPTCHWPTKLHESACRGVRTCSDSPNTAAHTAETPRLLLEHHLTELRLPTMLRMYDHRQCAVV